MQPPVDYPVNENVSAATLNGTTSNGTTSRNSMTYAALLDRFAAKQPITEDMIHAACLSMETAQQFPFATRPQPVNRDSAYAPSIDWMAADNSRCVDSRSIQPESESESIDRISSDRNGDSGDRGDDLIGRLLKARLLRAIR